MQLNNTILERLFQNKLNEKLSCQSTLISAPMFLIKKSLQISPPQLARSSNLGSQQLPSESKLGSQQIRSEFSHEPRSVATGPISSSCYSSSSIQSGVGRDDRAFYFRSAHSYFWIEQTGGRDS